MHMTKKVHKDVIEIFASTFGVPPESITPEVAYQTHEKWDSLRHLELISNLEERFNISISMDDVIAMSTVRKAEEIVARLLGGV